MTYDKKAFSTNAQLLRSAHGLSQREVAEACGTDVATVSRWESQRRAPEPKVAEKVAEFLGFELDMIDDGEDDEQGSATMCRYEGPCCMRIRGACTALNDTWFEDGVCHFRKATSDGPNLYDMKDKKKVNRVKVYCKDCRHEVHDYTGYWCEYTRLTVLARDYCSRGERRDDADKQQGVRY